METCHDSGLDRMLCGETAELSPEGCKGTGHGRSWGSSTVARQEGVRAAPEGKKGFHETGR